MSRAVGLAVILFSPLFAHADVTAGKSDGFYFAHGQAQSPNEVQAKDESCSRAKRDLIGYIFGLNTKVKSSVLVTNDKYDLTERVQVDSDWFQLKALRVTVTAQKIGSEYLATCNVQYAEAEADRELRRINKTQQVLAEKKLNRVSFENSLGPDVGKITVITQPPQAKIFVDSTFVGYSPVQINQVPVGTHDLSAQRDGFKTVTSSIKVGLGEDKRLNLDFTKNYSSLEVHGLPAGAKLWIDGQQSDGLKISNLAPGRKIVRAEAAGYSPYQDVINVGEGVQLRHDIHLTPKPVAVSFVSQGEPASVYVNGKAIGKTPLSRDLTVGSYSIDFLTSQGVIDQQSVTVNVGSPLKVVGKPVVTKTTAPKMSPVMVYKDPTLSVGKGFPSEKSVPQIYSRESQMIGVTLAHPTEGFLYVNGRLAGKQTVQIDNIDGELKVKAEAPGYYGDEFQFFGISAKNSAEAKGVSCTKNPKPKRGSIARGIQKFLSGDDGADFLEVRFHSDLYKSNKYCWNFPEYDPWSHFQFPLGTGDMLNRVELPVHLFRRIATQTTAPTTVDDGTTCCSGVLATLVFNEGDRYFLDKEYIGPWLARRYPGLKFLKYKTDDNFLYVTHIPLSFGRIPGIVQYIGTHGYDLKLPDSSNGYSSTILFQDTPDFKVSDRVIVVYDNAGAKTFIQKLRELSFKDDFSQSQVIFNQEPDRQLVKTRQLSSEDRARYGGN